jgi:hypothetical protein
MNVILQQGGRAYFFCRRDSRFFTGNEKKYTYNQGNPIQDWE